MTQHVRDVMTTDLVTVEPQASVTSVAEMMRDEDVGAVLVTDGEQLRGLVTDRDLVVRSVAAGHAAGRKRTRLNRSCHRAIRPRF